MKCAATKKWSKYLTALVLFAGVAVSGLGSTWAQDKSVSAGGRVQIPAASLSHFETAMQTISQQARITILSEGAPLHAEVTGESLTALQQTVPPDKSMSLDDALGDIAAAFDYDVEPMGARLYLLRKHYTNPDDIPLVTYDEITHALGEMLKVVKPYAFDDSGGYDENNAPKSISALRLVESFSPEQRAMASTALPLTALNPEQRQWAIDAENAHYLRDTVKTLRENLHRMQILPNPQTLLYGSIQERHYSLSYVYDDRSHSKDESEMRLFEFNITPVKVNKDGDTPSSANVFFDLPSETLRLAAGMMATALPETVTLQDAATQDSPHAFADGLPEIRVRVDKGIGAKPVTMFGVKFSTRPHFLRSPAALYHLQLLVPNEKNFTLTLPTAHATQNIGEVGAELQRLTPPLFRASYYTQSKMNTNMKKRLPEINIHQLYWHVALATHLLTRLFPPLKSQPALIKVPIISTGDETVRLIAIELFTFFNCDTSVTDLSRDNNRNLPYYLTDPDDEFIFVKEKNNEILRLGFGKRGDGTSKHRFMYDVPLPAPSN